MKSCKLALIVLGLVGAFALGNVVAQTGENPMMPAWMKLGQEHKNLAESCGDYTVTGKMWMAPGAPPMDFPGTAKREMILDGRFLKESFSGVFMGQKFTGVMIQGYDTVNKEHTNVWVDSMSPYMSVGRGTMKDGVITMHSTSPDETGAMQKNKSLVTLAKDSFKMSMFKVEKDGTESKQMEFDYARKK